MKKILLVVAVFCLVRANAQIYNAGFENWSTETSTFAGIPSVIPGDAAQFSDPSQWTSTNAVTIDTALGGLSLVTQSNTSHSGTSSVQLTTDTLKPVYIAALSATRQLCVPGMVLNGNFAVSNIVSNIVSFTNSSVTPGSVVGAGQPFSGRLANFSGFFQYTPVLNTFTGANDTCVIWATLRSGSTIVANAEFKYGAATIYGWNQFSVPFTYLNCEIPDTLVILIASSLPNFNSIVSGNTDLTPGSVLLVDDLSYDTLTTNIVEAVNDLDTVHRGDPDTLSVLSNDVVCNANNITVTIITAPAHGTATVLSNNEIVYTGSDSYYGVDSLRYQDDDGVGDTSTAWLKLVVEYGTGISEANQVQVKMFPVPASDNLHLQFANSGKTTARIYDIVGNLVSIVGLTQNDNNINVAGLTNGVYGIELSNESNTIIARTKFVVSR